MYLYGAYEGGRMNYEKAEKRLSDMNEKDILNDNDYEFLDEIGKSRLLKY